MDLPQPSTETLEFKIADNVSAMLAYWDKDLICRFANAAYLEWFGMSQHEMINKMTLPELLGPLYDQNLPYITGALNGRAQVFEKEIPLPQGKSKRYALANYYPEIENGEVKGFYVHMADISPIKKLEKKLQKSNAKVKKQNNRLLNFANIVSHNLKSYSGNIESLLKLYENADSDKEKAEIWTYLKSLSSEFSSTVADLNAIVKLKNQKEISFTDLSLNQFIERAKNILRVEIKESKATIKNRVDEGTTIKANPAYLESILLNILSNSLKYRNPEKPLEIELSSDFKKQQSVLSIKDNGLGIDLKKYGKDLFGMYKTFHGNADAQGIGLFITKYQVEAMGGEISVESEVKRGTTFNITFRG
ncbi:PAS domain-containing sensor histidine kinase [Salegentibacter salegens]|uniref:histidine kinase n=1 Tax=Salegentibacter salegens TaxID=143223 RepID=A0A1M7IZY7_9FLAO|nr:PAS domain-containing sensor histidine kinase [Salegentibacter salegens]PRX49874.1 PAS domain S-box-containing protein [Salegentibacter salegens]SHM46316.1 PAS domain S-box-containing protein [Salegentibacter salegens]